MTFADRLRKLRKESNLTQGEFASKIGISRSSESMYETGKRRPSFELADNIAMFFNVDLNYMLGNSDVRRSYGGLQEYFDAKLEELLTDDELTLVFAFRKASPELRQATLRMLGAK